MSWTSTSDGLPKEGVECLLCCMKADGSIVELIGYLQNGKWIIECDNSEELILSVRHWMPFAAERKII